MNKKIIALIINTALKHPDLYQIHLDSFYTISSDFCFSDLIVWDLDHSCPSVSIRLNNPLLSFIHTFYQVDKISFIEDSDKFLINRFSINFKFSKK